MARKTWKHDELLRSFALSLAIGFVLGGGVFWGARLFAKSEPQSILLLRESSLPQPFSDLLEKKLRLHNRLSQDEARTDLPVFEVRDFERQQVGISNTSYIHYGLNLKLLCPEDPKEGLERVVVLSEPFDFQTHRVNSNSSSPLSSEATDNKEELIDLDQLSDATLRWLNQALLISRKSCTSKGGR